MTAWSAIIPENDLSYDKRRPPSAPVREETAGVFCHNIQSIHIDVTREGLLPRRTDDYDCGFPIRQNARIISRTSKLRHAGL